MQRPGQDPVAKDDVPWWMKYAGRGLGTVGSIKDPGPTQQEESGVGSPQGTVPPTADHHTTLMEDPDVWRPTAPFGEMRTTAMDVQAPSSSMRSVLVENTQPIGVSIPANTPASIV
ncbi:hypothetical protein ALC60_01024 [Trachymyrmex zeteki]|uniref:Uncharacterized protein n=1 Tax=Mycetomoellerius zeteki TaxID=64791 RepID=A0A151XI16_9HYME|nr:hypothetical protein ALC60_01024 [Trachymyrmex zeteki]